MKINLSEIKKWGDIQTEYKNILMYCIDNWNNPDAKNSIEWNTLLSYKFIKKDIIDLKEIEMFDEYLFEITSNIFFQSYALKESDSNNVKLDINMLSSLTQEEIMEMHEDTNTSSDNKKSIYYKSLKNYGFISAKGDINTTMINQFSGIKKSFISTSLQVIKNYGTEWNSDIFNALIKMDIIKE